jgi:hypothetical protein
MFTIYDPETCTCGHTAVNAWAMEAHLRDVHDMDGNAYPEMESK